MSCKQLLKSVLFFCLRLSVFICVNVKITAVFQSLQVPMHKLNDIITGITIRELTSPARLCIHKFHGNPFSFRSTHSDVNSVKKITNTIQ